jgi:hypothetical protein
MTNTTEPNWGERAWGRPIIFWRMDEQERLEAEASGTSYLVATCDFRYYGMKVRGVRILRTKVTGFKQFEFEMPSLADGSSYYYFLRLEEREQFFKDIAYLCHEQERRLTHSI